MSRTETFRNSVKQASEVKSLSIFEAAEEMKTAGQELLNQANSAKLMSLELNKIATEMPEQMASAMLPLSQALNKQIADNQTSVKILQSLMKKQVSHQADIHKSLKAQSKILETRHLKLERQMRDFEAALKAATASQRPAVPILPMAIIATLAAAPAAGVLFMLHQAGLTLM